MALLARCQSEKYSNLAGISAYIGVSALVACTVIFTSGSVGGIVASGFSRGSGAVDERNFGPFHHKVLDIISSAESPRDAKSAGLDLEAT